MKNKNYPLYEVKHITNLRQLVDFRAEESKDMTVFSYEESGRMIKITYGQLKEETEALGTVFFEWGIKDAKVAILGENSYNWLVSFFTLTGGNNIAVPLDKEQPVDMIEKLICDSESSVLIYSDTYSDVAESLKGKFPIQYINMNEIPDLIKEGAELIKRGNDKYLNHKTDEDSPIVIMYTSGTTGISKGVMLSHKNLALDTYSACCNCSFYGDTLLVLPLHHAFGLVAGVFVIMFYGYTVHINTSLRNLSADLIRVKPQCLFLVPLFVETLYKNIWNAIESKRKNKPISFLIKISNAMLKVGIDIRRKVFKTILTSFGGKMDMIICGGAPLNSKYIQGFRDFGINLLNGYGITECSPVVSVNRNDFYKDGSVGQILNECSVKIDSPDSNGIGEICVKGSVVMKGYYKMEDETAKVLQDGWFHTGDTGYIDEDNFLYIAGRKKNLIILGNGENVSPEELEKLIQDIPLVCETVVYECGGKITAEIYPDFQYTENNSVQDIKKTLEYEISKLNRNLPRFKQINAVKIRNAEFEKTTTKKIKRNSIGG